MIIIDDTFQSIKSESSSKGNQTKFYKDGYWFKLDNDRCHEGLAEEIASLFASCIVDFPYVPYKITDFTYNDENYTGCYSSNMYTPVTEFISLRRLFKQNNRPLNMFIKNEDISVNIRNVVETVGKDTGINIFQYLNRLLYFDTLILNEDRHYMNLGVAYDKSNGFMQASCFDNGSSMFCTNWTYRKTKTLSENLLAAKSVARPFSKFYDKQILALQKLGAKPLKISKVNLDNIFVNYNSVFYKREQQDLALSVLKARLDYNTDKGVFVYV